ncbi:hypothetical protein [Novosphingobium sp. ST904]|uniref:hypothetical protein n=1 Tax=Novosphingobium sp. ST904 TaxID=1684385 RepID=UPI000B2D8113|nr:hypothetical protein [Novosphingobium sp. ST904]
MTEQLTADKLVGDALVEQAMKDTGIRDFDNDTWREGFDVFVNDFNAGIARGSTQRAASRAGPPTRSTICAAV